MELRQTFENRVSTRDFDQTPVGKDALRALLTAALYAPVGMHRYGSLCLTVVTNPTLLEKIRLVTAKETRNEKADPLHGAPAIILVSSSEPAEISMANTACMIENMLLQATELGLASLYVRGAIPFVAKDEALCKELRIPQGFLPYAAAAVGYPKVPVIPRSVPANSETTIIELD